VPGATVHRGQCVPQTRVCWRQQTTATRWRQLAGGIVLAVCICTLKPILAATPARSISLPRPATVNGAPLSETRVKADLAGRFSSRSARNSSLSIRKLTHRQRGRPASARSGCRRGRPLSSSRRRKTETEIRRRAPDHAHRDQFDLAVLEVIAVVQPVLLVESRDHLADVARHQAAAAPLARARNRESPVNAAYCRML
jgi:hypothetical protein